MATNFATAPGSDRSASLAAKRGRRGPSAGAPPALPTRQNPRTKALALAFYNGKEFGTWVDRLIACHDRGVNVGPYSHVELVFDRVEDGQSLCYSASYRDGGVRFKRIDLDETARKWVLVPVIVEPEEAAAMRAWCEKHVGGRYDIPGVLSFKLPWVRHRLNWWFCSEIVTAALQQVGLLRDVEAHKTSPNSLFRLVTGLVPRRPRV